MVKKRRIRKAVICAGVVTLLVLVVVGNLKKQRTRARLKQGEPVQVKKGTVIDKLTETGEIHFARVVKIEPGISGKVKQLLVGGGNWVEEGQLLVIIEPGPDQLLRLYSKRTGRDQALITLREKERELERQRALFEKKHISRETVEQAEDAWRLAHSTHQQALLELKILEKEMGIESSDEKTSALSRLSDPNSHLKLADHHVLSPIAGIISSSQIEEGEMVISGTSSMAKGTVLFEIGDPSRMTVVSQVNEVDVARLAPGQEVKIVVHAYPEESFLGRVAKIAPAGKMSMSNVIVFDTQIDIESTDHRIKPGMSCDVDITVEQKEETLYLPIEAVAKIYKKDEQDEETNEIEKTVVFLKTDKDYQESEVTIGLESSNRIEILAGVSEGDEVHPDAAKMRKEREEKEEKEKKSKKGKKDKKGKENKKGQGENKEKEE